MDDKPACLPACLIVEDDFLVRLVAVDIADEAGFAIVVAADAEEALGLLQNRPDIRVVLTDIDLPGYLDGLELARAVQTRWPLVRVVVTSGKMRPDSDELPESSVFVNKPYDAGGLTGLLRDLVS